MRISPGWTGDPERETWLDRAREHDDPPLEVEYADYTPLTEEELAEIREAAADELLAVKAATTGRRGPGQPGSARVFPGESSSPAAAFGPGHAAGCAAGLRGVWRSPPTPPRDDDRFDGVPEGELVGVLCAWDRVEAHAAARKLAVIAELDRRNPKPEDAEFTADEIANALGESRTRAYALTGHGRSAGHPSARHPRGAATTAPSAWRKARIIATATALLDEAEARAAEAEVLDRAARLTPGGLRAAIARAVDRSRPEEGEGTPGDRGEVRAGGAVGRGLRQRRPDGPRAPAG